MRLRIPIHLLVACVVSATLLTPGRASGQVDLPPEPYEPYFAFDELHEPNDYLIGDIAGSPGVPSVIHEELVLADGELVPYLNDGYDFDADPALFQQQAPAVPQQQTPQATPQPPAGQTAASDLFGDQGAQRSLLAPGTGVSPASAQIATNSTAQTRATTDAGNLLGKTPSVLGVGTQRRNPIVTDPRIRGSRVGTLAASGS